MPSFFESLKRMAEGKPVFTESEETGQPQPVQASTNQKTSGPKIIPQVVVQYTNCHINGADMECQCVIKNNSQVTIELDKIKLLGMTHELDSLLHPGEEREYQVYSGHRPQDTYNTECQLTYKDPRTGDYFCTVHYVEFQLQSDKTYSIKNLKFIPPVRDV